MWPEGLGPRLGAAIACLLTGAALLTLCGFLAPAPVAQWLMQSGLHPAFLVPGLGLGLALSQMSRRSTGTVFLGWAAGIGLGIFFSGGLFALIGQIPGATSHHFLLFPASVLAIGGALLAGWRALPVLGPPLALLAGTACGASIVLYDPSAASGDVTIRLLGAGLGLWLPLTAALLLGCLPLRVGRIGGRIAGSWLVAIGLLYGGLAAINPPGVPYAPVLAPPPGAMGGPGSPPVIAGPGGDAFPGFGSSTTLPGQPAGGFQP
ncbi:hypothetical protein KM176_07095 [Pseudooceanicola sp. CBS1P-1]|uniref:Uncharacterized protein n=1 Tax=Pseudooceanicola albus TaxID=2692189 RepID=A0A6L7G4A1_9RHOB|nr:MULTISPECIES: hypothetical protein [Pseudooceanicola]MBT9383618.1 hypothetical protein [Pseudooceanicola endophyticus]MXN17473.1 hypothetical protein [Pseudooceanicola albus]